MPRTLLAVGRGPELRRVVARAESLRLRTAAAAPPGERTGADRLEILNRIAGEPVTAAARATLQPCRRPPRPACASRSGGLRPRMAGRRPRARRARR